MLSKSDGKKITLTVAAQMTKDYRIAHPGTTKAVFFGSNHIQDILDQTDCVGVRVYFAENSSGENTIVLVGAKEDESDMETGHIVDTGVACPTVCANGSLDT